MSRRISNCQIQRNDSAFGRSTRFAPFGKEGQENSRVRRPLFVIVWLRSFGDRPGIVGARPCFGLGTIRLIDRDYVEESNLQRQLLYTETDACQGLPKAEAARRHLLEANSGIRIETHVSDLNPENADDSSGAFWRRSYPRAAPLTTLKPGF